MEYVTWNGFKAFPENLPISLPGAYRITNLVNGKTYIGISMDVANRCKHHASATIVSVKSSGRPQKRLSKFVHALRKYGAASFLVEPVLYSLESFDNYREDGLWLKTFETELIISSNSVENGYNVLENWMGGPGGAEFRAILKEAHGTPERRAASSAKTTKDFQDPERRRKQSEATLNYLEQHPEESGKPLKDWWISLTPEEKEAFTAKHKPARIARLKELYDDPERVAALVAKVNTPETIAKRNTAIAQAYAAPGGKDKLLASRKDPDYLANQSVKGKERFSTEEAIQQARDAQAAVADKHAASLRGAWEKRPRFWITDGQQSTHHFADLPIPEGWRRGRVGLFGSAAAKQKLIQSRPRITIY